MIVSFKDTLGCILVRLSSFFVHFLTEKFLLFCLLPWPLRMAGISCVLRGCARSQHRGCCLVLSRAEQHVL